MLLFIHIISEQTTVGSTRLWLNSAETPPLSVLQTFLSPLWWFRSYTADDHSRVQHTHSCRCEAPMSQTPPSLWAPPRSVGKVSHKTSCLIIPVLYTQQLNCQKTSRCSGDKPPVNHVSVTFVWARCILMLQPGVVIVGLHRKLFAFLQTLSGVLWFFSVLHSPHGFSESCWPPPQLKEQKGHSCETPLKLGVGAPTGGGALLATSHTITIQRQPHSRGNVKTSSPRVGEHGFVWKHRETGEVTTKKKESGFMSC